MLSSEAGLPTSRRLPSLTLVSVFSVAATLALAGCGGGGSGSPDAVANGAASSAESTANGGADSAAAASALVNANEPILAISTKAAISTSAVTTSALTKLTPLQVVQKIFHDRVDWYPGSNDPYSSAMRAWANWAASSFFNSERTFEQAYALLQEAIITDARRSDPSIPATGHPFPRATYRAQTLDWMTALTDTSGDAQPNTPTATKAPLQLSPMQAVQKIFHDLVDWYPGGNQPGSSAMIGWAGRASNEFFTSSRSYQEAYSLLQATILTDARRYDSSIPVAGHPYPRATYNAPTLSWMSEALDTDTSSGETGTKAPAATPSTPATPPAQSASSSGTINTVDTIVNDMRLRNDAPLRGYEGRSSGWYVGPGYVMLGIAGTTSNTPNWWKAANPSYVNNEPMRALLPWVVIFDGVNNSASNTRVQIRNFRAYYKSRSSGQWVSLGSSAGAAGAVYGKSTLYGSTTGENRRTNGDGSTEIKPPSNTSTAWHGWWQRGRVAINPSDVAALFTTLQARLVVDNPSAGDDRSRAQYLVQIGADYYRSVSTSWPFVIPSAMTARSKLVTNNWQSYSATTFSNVGVQEPGGGITEAAFRAAPPPLE